MQEWEVINFSQPLALNNVVCSLAGESPQEIVILAHHDQFSGTIQGADNDGSGTAIMLELAKIFAAEGTPAYTLTFLSSDGEEYGMLGSGHYIETHPNPEQIILIYNPFSLLFLLPTLFGFSLKAAKAWLVAHSIG